MSKEGNTLKQARPCDFRMPCSLLLTVFFFFFGLFSCCAMDKPAQRSVVGGPCEYKVYRGHARIVSIIEKENPLKVGGPSNVVYEVKYSFTSHEEIKEKWVQVEGEEYLLLLSNSSYPGPEFLKKYGIKPDKCFECYLKVITRGSCTPVLFDFPTINIITVCRV